MKKTILFVWTVSFALSCSTDVSMYDDTKLKDSISDLEARVAKLETLCDQMNSNISALQAVVVALQNKEYVESIKPLPDNQGYSFSFSSGRFVTVYNGKDGRNGADGKDGENGRDGVDGKDGVTPAIGVRQDTDGVWYWTLNGDWLYADGRKVKAVGSDGKDGVDGTDGRPGSDGKDGADGKDGESGADGKDGTDGKDGVTPKLKIEGGMWYVSCDEGVSWEQLGKATGDDGADAGIISVTEDSGYVHFGMSDGTVITIAKRMPLMISFDSDDVAITVGGASRTIGYTLAGASEKVVVKTLTQDGWKARVNQVSSLSGSIEITAPNPLVESEILVFVSDGGQTALAAVNCVKATVIISQEQYDVAATGGELEITSQANTNFLVSIPDEAKSWLGVASTKSMITRPFSLAVAANKEALARNAVVSLVDESGNTIRTFVVNQFGDLSGLVTIHVDTKGSLHSLLAAYDKAYITKLKITGALSDVDFLDIHYEMPALRYLDISAADVDVLPKDCFNGSDITTVVLPETLVEISENCFKDSSLSGDLIIPGNCKTIGRSAFRNCKGLENVRFPVDSKLVSIGGGYSGIEDYGAFSNCSALRTINIPKGVMQIEAAVFKCCKSLVSVSFALDSALEEICGGYYFGYDSKYIGIDYGAFCECSLLKTITIPRNVKNIGASAFKNCTSLSNVVIPNDSLLKTIAGGSAVYNDSQESSSRTFSFGAFFNCVKLGSFYIPAEVESIGQSAFKNCSSLRVVTFAVNSRLRKLEGGYTKCGYYRGIDCGYHYISGVGICVPQGAFCNTALQSIAIPASVTEIGAFCFSDSCLTDIAFADDSMLYKIGSDAFRNCGLLHRIYMQKCSKLKEIDDRALYGNDQIYFLQIGAATPPKLGENVFGSVGVYSVLKVPAGSESAYKNASGWNAFSSITAID